jgi:hypothetical protein
MEYIILIQEIYLQVMLYVEEVMIDLLIMQINVMEVQQLQLQQLLHQFHEEVIMQVFI